MTGKSSVGIRKQQTILQESPSVRSSSRKSNNTTTQNITPKKSASSPVKTPSRAKRTVNGKSRTPKNDKSISKAKTSANNPMLKTSRGETYLHRIARKVKTSDNRFSDSLTAPYTSASLHEALEGTSLPMVPDTPDYTKAFDQWVVELSNGFSVLFYGLGSKLRLLNEFANTTLRKSGYVIILNGYNVSEASRLVPDLLDTLEDQVLVSKTVTSTLSSNRLDRLEERAQHIADRLLKHPLSKPIYILVHTLESTFLRSPRSHIVLATLASQPQVHLLGSIDHMNSALLFSSETYSARSQSNGFNFIYHHVPTFAAYSEEVAGTQTASQVFPKTVFRPDRISASSSKVATTAESARYVIASIPANAKKLLSYLLEHQLDSLSALSPRQISTIDLSIVDLENPPFFALSYSAVLSHGRANFFSSSSAMLDTLLQELRDHQIVIVADKPPDANSEYLATNGMDTNGDDTDQGKREWLWVGMPHEELLDLKETLITN